MSPEEYLKEHGIDMEKTVLITYIDGVVRNPSLIALMQGYANTNGCARCKEVCDHYIMDGFCVKCGQPQSYK